MRVLRSPTNMAWLLGRTQTNGPEDYAAVHAVQDGYKLVPLSKFGTSYVPAKVAVDPGFDAKTPPVEKLKRMSAAQYFDMLARLLKAIRHRQQMLRSSQRWPLSVSCRVSLSIPRILILRSPGDWPDRCR